MKIVHVTWMFTFGGIETMLVNICNEQVKLGHEVHIVVMQDGVTEKTLRKALDQHVKVHYCHRSEGGSLLLPALRLNWLLLKLNPNIIHLHSSGIIRLIGPRKFRNIANSTLHALPKKENTVAIKQVPRVFAISNAVRQALLAYNGTDSICNPNGIRPEFITQRHSSEWKGCLQIVQVSRLDHADKGQHILIQAASELRKRGYHNFIINFIGGGPSQSYLESLVNELGLNGKIVFHGMKTQEFIFEHLCDFDVFVQPSIREGFGNTIAEAMAAKVPVIVSSGQGPEEVTEYGKYGYVFENGNPIDCADKLELFLKHENDTTFVDGGYQHVLDMYDIKVTVRKYLENYLKR